MTLPNVVSLSRLVLAAAFVALRAPSSRLALLVVASATDFLDGWLARRRHATTRSGALIDPIADRLFVFTALCDVSRRRGHLARRVLHPAVARHRDADRVHVVARSVPWLRAVEFRARWLGKVVTVLQLVTLMAVLVDPGRLPWLVLVVGAASGGVDRGLHAHAVARARDVSDVRPSRGAIVGQRVRCAAAAAFVCDARAIAQAQAAPRPRRRGVQPEARADFIDARAARRTSVWASAFPRAHTCALGLVGAAGQAWSDGRRSAAGRVDGTRAVRRRPAS